MILAIEKMKSCKECPHSHSIEWKSKTEYYCDKAKRRINIKAGIPKRCPLRKFGLIEESKECEGYNGVTGWRDEG